MLESGFKPDSWRYGESDDHYNGGSLEFGPVPSGMLRNLREVNKGHLQEWVKIIGNLFLKIACMI